MIVDHAGYYFYPEDDWWRVLGRFCVPVWFFLIGYAKTRELTMSMWMGGTILVIANVFAGLFIFPLNILFTMMFVRVFLERVMFHVLKGQHELWATCAVLFFLIVPTSMITEYGTQAIIMAMYGYMVRYRNDSKEIQKIFIPFSIFALLGFVAVQAFLFGLSGEKLIALEVGTFVVMGALYFFKPVTFPKLTGFLPSPVVGIFQIGGRRTLEIYVIHLLLFKFLAVFYGRFDVLDWTWTVLAS